MDVADAIDRARRLQEQGRADEALEILLAAAKEHHDEDLDAEVALFYTERGWKRPDPEALADFEEAKRWAELPLTLAGEAAIRVKRGELEKADAFLSRALELDPELPAALSWLGRLRHARGQHGLALEAFAKAIELAPTFGPDYAWLADSLLQLERREEARQVLLDGVRRCPYEDGLFDALGDFYSGERDFEKARQAWRRAVEINRGHVSAWRGLAWASAQMGDEVEMCRALDRAMELDPEGTPAWLEKEKSSVPLLNAYVK